MCAECNMMCGWSLYNIINQPLDVSFPADLVHPITPSSKITLVGGDQDRLVPAPLIPSLSYTADVAAFSSDRRDSPLYCTPVLQPDRHSPINNLTSAFERYMIHLT